MPFAISRFLRGTPKRLDSFESVEKFRFLSGRREIVDAGFRTRISAASQQEFDQLHVIPCGCIVQGSIVVHSTLLDIRAARQKQFDELALVRTVGGYGRDKRGKAGVILM
jgi:hypothetical protein